MFRKDKLTVWNSIRSMGVLAFALHLSPETCHSEVLPNPTKAIESIHTDLDSEKCRNEIDPSDPNETPYRLCPGVGGYKLIVRHVDSGKQSIDIVEPSGRLSPLFLQKYIGPHMFNLVNKVEWRVTAKAGKRVPIGLIVRVQSRQDEEDPSKVTHMYDLVAKITAQDTCITRRILAGEKSEAEVRNLADSPELICEKGY
jgi:hypothetical protein